jgi:sulfide dehydrogenase cytochrome subunit
MIPAFAAVTMFLAAPGAGFAADLPPPGASSCSGCHAATVAVRTPVPRLTGHSSAEITEAMREFRNGKRPATVMDRIAKGFTDAETAAVAIWYAGQKQ